MANLPIVLERDGDGGLLAVANPRTECQWLSRNLGRKVLLSTEDVTEEVITSPSSLGEGAGGEAEAARRIIRFHSHIPLT
jgi:hypothetical protein